MSVWDSWTDVEDEVMAEPMQIDVTTDAGFRAMETQIVEAARARLRDRWESMAGADLARIADEMATDFQQSSVSLPKSAFANPEAAGRELAIVRRVYRYIAEQQLRIAAQYEIGWRMAFPPTAQTVPAEARGERQPSRQHRRRLQRDE